MWAFTLAIWILGLIDAAIAARVYWQDLRGKPPGFSFWRNGHAVLRAALIAGAIGAFKAVVITVAVGHPLAAVHVMLVWCALVPATIGVVGLIHAVPHLHGASRGVATLAAVAVLGSPLVCAYATLIEPFWLKIEEATLPAAGMAVDAESIRVVVLADVQTDRIGDYERDVLAQTNALAPDLILLPGDFLQGFGRRDPELGRRFVEWLDGLEAQYGVYACLGNVDPPELVTPLFADAGVTLLRDAAEVVDVRGTRVAIGGTNYDRRSATDPPFLHAMRDIDADVRLLMAHKPDAVLGASPDDQVDLIVSGHTHGGQVVLPGFGPLVTFSHAPHHICAGGLHTHAGQRIYVSRGVGHERGIAPPLRFWCRPELTHLTLTPKSP